MKPSRYSRTSLIYTMHDGPIHSTRIQTVLDSFRFKRNADAVAATKLIQDLLARIVYLENELKRAENGHKPRAELDGNSGAH